MLNFSLSMLFISIVLICSLLKIECFFTSNNGYKHRNSLKHSYTTMNMFDRMFRVVTSNVNSVIKSLEDPEKIIEQAVEDMQKDLIKIRQSYAEISATQKRMEKQREQAQANADEWYRRAQLALEKNDEELAREALSRRQVQLEQVESLDKTLVIQNSNVDKLYASMIALDTKVAEARREKEAMIARARTAKTTVKVTDMLNSVGGSSSMEAFDRMKDKVENLESQAQVAGELAASNAGTSSTMEERFRLLEGTNKVDDELQMLKRKQLPGITSATEPIAELPASTTAPKSELDLEYEKLKKELGRR